MKGFLASKGNTRKRSSCFLAQTHGNRGVSAEHNKDLGKSERNTTGYRENTNSIPCVKLQIFQRYFSTRGPSASLLGLETQHQIQESIYLTKHASNPVIFSRSPQTPKIGHELKCLAESSPQISGLEVCGFPWT